MHVIVDDSHTGFTILINIIKCKVVPTINASIVLDLLRRLKQTHQANFLKKNYHRLQKSINVITIIDEAFFRVSERANGFFCMLMCVYPCSSNRHMKSLAFTLDWIMHRNWWILCEWTTFMHNIALRLCTWWIEHMNCKPVWHGDTHETTCKNGAHLICPLLQATRPSRQIPCYGNAFADKMVCRWMYVLKGFMMNSILCKGHSHRGWGYCIVRCCALAEQGSWMNAKPSQKLPYICQCKLLACVPIPHLSSEYYSRARHGENMTRCGKVFGMISCAWRQWILCCRGMIAMLFGTGTTNVKVYVF